MAAEANPAPNPALKWVLRFFGTSSLLGTIFVVAPYAWMDSIHADLGMGRLPDEPVVGYLARSTSAFYAILGGLFWVLSFDLERHRTVLVYLGSAILLLGAALLGVDWVEGMPLFWKLWEGPVVMALGFFILSSSRRLADGRR